MCGITKHRPLTTSKPCPFCALLSERIVEENQLALWIYDIFLVSKGHCLIIPKRHLGSFFYISLVEGLAMLELLDRAKAAIDKELKPDGFNIGNGPAAGQTVPHLHLHLILRYAGDVEDARGGFLGSFRNPWLPSFAGRCAMEWQAIRQRSLARSAGSECCGRRTGSLAGFRGVRRFRSVVILISYKDCDSGCG